MAIRQKGTKFQVDVTVAGKRSPRISCDTMTEARKVEADFKAKLLAGVPPDMLVTTAPSGAARKGTLGMAAEVAYKHQWQGRKSADSSLRNAEAWCLELGRDFPLDKLTAEKIGEVCDGWGAAGNAAGTINRKLAALSVMMKLAVEDGLIDRVPRLPKRKEYEGRLRYYTDAEVDSLLDWVKGDMEVHDLFILAVETGMRAGEMFGLIKRDIDFTRKLVLLGETKGNVRRSVPLTEAAVRALTRRAQPKLDHEPVFSPRLNANHTSRVIRAWKDSRGLPAGDEACFHTFRHTTCSRLVQRGVPLTVVQKFMGHADITTTMRYAHLAPDSLELARAALERIAA
jgi:integrase